MKQRLLNCSFEFSFFFFLSCSDTAGSVLENQKSTKALYKGAQVSLLNQSYCLWGTFCNFYSWDEKYEMKNMAEKLIFCLSPPYDQLIIKMINSTDSDKTNLYEDWKSLTYDLSCHRVSWSYMTSPTNIHLMMFQSCCRT